MINWSAEQSAIFEWFGHGNGHLIVKARAGTGKTTTIKAAFEHAPEPKILYAVFNKKNQREADAKITDERVDVMTLHSLGYRFIKRVWSNAKPDDEVESDRVAKAMAGSALSGKVVPEIVAMFTKLIGFAKNTTIHTTAADLRDISLSQDIDFTGLDGWEDVALKAMSYAHDRDPAGRISFNDMVWLPVVMNLVRPWYNLVVVDEAQDMNLPQLQMARGASNGRVVVVGDDRQAIYGFRGAVGNGMGMMKVTLRAAELTLTTTYRCPKAVVRIAQEFVPDYQADESAPEGEVASVEQVALLRDAKPGDAVLSRLNAPLMPLALAFLRIGTPARIEGRDIGKQLVGMVRSMKARSVPHFIERVESWRGKQQERLAKGKNAEKKIEQANDIADTLIAIAEGATSVVDIESRINNLFQDTDANSRPAVVLSSVHKAKGLEWPRVWLLRETFRQSKGGEEANVYYVAVTRAMRSLYLVGGTVAEKPVDAPAAQPEPIAQPLVATPEVAKSEPLTKGNRLLPTRDPSVAYPATNGKRAEWDGVDTPPPGFVFRSRGVVFDFNGIEFVVTSLGKCNAVAESLTSVAKTFVAEELTPEGPAKKEVTIKGGRAIVKVSTTIGVAEVLRVMSDDEIANFSSGAAGRKKTIQPPAQKEEIDMSKKKAVKTGSKKASGGIAGAAQYVRDAVAKGDNKSDIYAATLKKWPAFESDKAGLDSRYNTAVKIAKNAKANGTPAPKSAKSKTSATPKPKAKAAKKSAAPKGKAPSANPPPPRSTPPPPAAPAPVATPESEPVAGEPVAV